MILVFVHGWSVTHTDTYGRLPEALAEWGGDLGLDLRSIQLGRYVSFHDEVTVDDLVIAFDRALRDALAPDGGPLPEFSCVTHSTGGPVAREWVRRYWGPDRLGEMPLRHLVMLAPANHGSPLAVLGKERVGRIKAWFGGVEPGVRILEWLALGSAGQRALGREWLGYAGPEQGFFPFVLTGQSIDEAFYDFLNTYLVEVGSDGVVRVAGANLNYAVLSLRETAEPQENPHFAAAAGFLLAPDGPVRRPRRAALGVMPKASHSGTRIGIMASVGPENIADKPVLHRLLDCLRVGTAAEYDDLAAQLREYTNFVQAEDQRTRGHRYINLVVSVVDDRGEPVEDFDFFLLAGADYDPSKLPKGFFVDRQKNRETPNTLVYYLDYDVLKELPQESFGVRVHGRPAGGFAGYRPVEFHADGQTLAEILRPNQTTYVEIVLHRHVDTETFRLDPGDEPRRSFKSAKPSGRDA